MTTDSFFKSRNAIDLMHDGSKLAPQRKIGGAFLLEDTTTYIFSRTNYGKSILAFQLAYAAATGTSLAPCAALQNECPPMKVLVLDLELGDRELFKRHHLILENEDPLIKENLYYLHEKIENPMMIGLGLLNQIEPAIVEHNAKLVIIDNISKLLPDSLKHDQVAIVIAFLDRIRQKTGASILAIGHTTKGNPGTAIQSVDFFGSSMLQNFFKELSYLDKTKDGRFFLCNAKTKCKDPYDVSVPVFTRGDHPVVGVGFNYEELMPLSEVQLPYVLAPQNVFKKRNINNYRKEISILDHGGVSKARIAEIFGVSRGTVYQVFEN